MQVAVIPGERSERPFLPTSPCTSHVDAMVEPYTGCEPFLKHGILRVIDGRTANCRGEYSDFGR